MDNSQKINITQKMMNDPFQYLDRVLTYMAMDKKTTLKLSTKEIWEGLKEQPQGFDLSEGTLRLIIDKLIKDGNIFTNNPGELKVYKITFEGLVFQKQGGYKQQLLNDTLQKRKEESNRKTQKILFWFTFIVAVGTLIEAIWYIKELCKPN